MINAYLNIFVEEMLTFRKLKPTGSYPLNSTGYSIPSKSAQTEKFSHSDHSPLTLLVEQSLGRQSTYKSVRWPTVPIKFKDDFIVNFSNQFIW